MSRALGILVTIWVATALVLTSMYFHVPVDARPCLYENSGSSWDTGYWVKVDPGYRICHHGQPDEQPINLGIWP